MSKFHTDTIAKFFRNFPIKNKISEINFLYTLNLDENRKERFYETDFVRFGYLYHNKQMYRRTMMNVVLESFFEDDDILFEDNLNLIESTWDELQSTNLASFHLETFLDKNNISLLMKNFLELIFFILQEVKSTGMQALSTHRMAEEISLIGFYSLIKYDQDKLTETLKRIIMQNGGSETILINIQLGKTILKYFKENKTFLLDTDTEKKSLYSKNNRYVVEFIVFWVAISNRIEQRQF